MAPFARQATRTIPIVMATSSDPVRGGLVASLARPGGNITGLSSAGVGQATKSFEVFKEGAPHLTSIAILMDLSNPAQVAQIPELEAAAHTLGVKIQRVDVRSAADLEAAFAGLFARTRGTVLVCDACALSARVARHADGDAR